MLNAILRMANSISSLNQNKNCTILKMQSFKVDHSIDRWNLLFEEIKYWNIVINSMFVI